MQRPMRRSDRALSREEALGVLSRAACGVLSTACDGVPYGVPLSFVVLDEAIYFHCAQSGRKIDALRGNPRVSFCAVECGSSIRAGTGFTTHYESAIAEGVAVLVSDASEHERSLLALCEKYVPGEQAHAREGIALSGARTTVVRIDIATLTGKANRPQA